MEGLIHCTRWTDWSTDSGIVMPMKIAGMTRVPGRMRTLRRLSGLGDAAEHLLDAFIVAQDV